MPTNTTPAGTIIIRERQLAANGSISLELPMVAMARVQVVLGGVTDNDVYGIEDDIASASIDGCPVTRGEITGLMIDHARGREFDYGRAERFFAAALSEIRAGATEVAV